MKNTRSLSILFGIALLPVMVSAQSVSREDFLNLTCPR